MPDDNPTSLASRIDAIEEDVQELRRGTRRLSGITARNVENLGRAMTALDELLYAALASGHELMPGDPGPQTTGTEASPRRCSHPAHDADPVEARPAATHLIGLRSPHAESGKPHPPLPRCAECAARVLESPSAPRISIRKIEDEELGARTPRCQSPVHLAAERPPASTVIVTAGVRPGIRYCNACAKTTRTTLQRHRIPFESAPIVTHDAGATQGARENR